MALVRKGGMQNFLHRAGVRLLEFKDFVRATSKRLEQASLADAERSQRPIRYLPASSTDKEATARRLLAEFPIEQALIRVLRIIEPCVSFRYERSTDWNERGLKLQPRKCLHTSTTTTFTRASASCAPGSGPGFPSTFRSASTDASWLGPEARSFPPKSAVRFASCARTASFAKVPKSHRYRLTAKDQLLTAALFAARDANLKQLLAKAA